MMGSLTENNHQQTLKPLCNRQSFSWHTRQQYEFAEPYGRNTGLVSDSPVL